MRTKIDSFLSALHISAAVLMAAAFPFSFALFNIGIVILITSFFLRRIWNRNFSPFDAFQDTVLVLFFVSSCVSVFSSGFPSMSFQGIHKLLRYLLVFIAAREIFISPKYLKLTAAGLLAGAAVTGFDGAVQYLTGTDPIRGQTVSLGFHNLIRISACFSNPNTLAVYLSVLLPFIFCLASYGNLSKPVRASIFTLFFLLAGCMYLTYARPAFLALLINGGMLILIKRDKKLLFLCALFFGAGVLFLQQEVKDWVLQLSSLKDFLVDQGRYYHHHAAINMIKASPWFGLGLNTFDVNYAQYRLPGDTFTRWSAHQGYLQMAAETGLVTLAFFLILLSKIACQSWRCYRRIEIPFIQTCMLGFLGGFIAFLTAGFFESLFWQPRQANFFWFWTGMMCGLAKYGFNRTVKTNSGEAVWKS